MRGRNVTLSKIPRSETSLSLPPIRSAATRRPRSGAQSERPALDSSEPREESEGFEADLPGERAPMMVGFMGKRKELEQVVDGLSDFSLSGPAAKSRRLDPGLPPILEEEPPAPPIPFQHDMLGEEINSGVSMPIVEDMMEGAMPSHLSSEDRALVLYKPVNNPILFGPNIPNPSIIVSSDLIRGLKNQAFNQGNCPGLEYNSPERSNCLALVPWAPLQIAMTSNWSGSQPENEEIFEGPMDAEEAEVISMDFEEAPQATAGLIDGENLQQWQQHCMTPPSLPNPSAPVMWSW